MPSGFCGSVTVLGIGVGFQSESPEALNAALALFPDRNPYNASAPAPSVYVVLSLGCASPDSVEGNRVRGTQLEIVRHRISLNVDGQSGRATCSFPIDATDSEVFREVINTAVLFLVAQAGRVPVHASAIMIGDCAYVLAGRSGSGKSVLALAANRAGLPVLAEDTVFVQLSPHFRVWGFTQTIHVCEKDMPINLAGDTRIRSGRLKRAIEIDRLHPWADKAALFVLARGDTVRVDPLRLDDAVRTLTSDPEPGYDFYGARMEDAIRAIAAGGCWQLTSSENPDAAIGVLSDRFGGRAQIVQER